MSFKKFLVKTEMVEWFNSRTNKHISLVRKYGDMIADNYPEYDELIDIVRNHDASKFVEPEHTPYIHISWKYKCADKGVDYKIPDGIDDTSATLHHVKNNKHHPEYWSTQDDVINSENRDKPKEVIFAQDMPNIYVAEMVADWCAMSEERGGHPKDWADKNVGVRWDFTEEQIEIIYDIINNIWRDDE